MSGVPGTEIERSNYTLETLYEHQEHDFVVDTIPHVIAWVPSRDVAPDPQPFMFHMDVASPGGTEPRSMEIALAWNMEALERHDVDLSAKVARLRSGRSVDRERVTENAAYGLALVAISVLMPGRRVITICKGEAPDFLLDATPGALRGVEVAGRSSGGLPALRSIRLEKGPRLVARRDIAEVHISLWCAAPRVSELYQVKP
ncbi:hypothetical protein [Sorangium sp. So ce513]|uniref:hypothetical protein n=1 Tax=Sorangium sp. So ce513 TaxID=3133315 RepID=UPI003F642940